MSPDEEAQAEATPQAVPPPAAPPTVDPPTADPEAPAPAAAAPAGAGEGRPARVEPPRRDSRGRDDGDDRRGGGGGRRFFGRRKVCSFCVEKAKMIDYKDPAKLRRFVSDRGRIEGRRRTGTCAKHQRWLATALKRARHLALLPYSPEHIRMSGAFASRRR